MQEAAPSALIAPRVQSEHVEASVAPVAAEDVPAAQAVQSKAVCAALYLPTGQSLQSHAITQSRNHAISQRHPWNHTVMEIACVVTGSHPLR